MQGQLSFWGDDGIDPEEIKRAAARARAVAWRQANRERHRAYSRQWTEDHPDRVRERLAAWHRENKERARDNERARRARDPDAHRAYQREDRRKRYLNRDGEAYAYSLILRADPCAYCGGPATAADHIEPLSGGGANAWDNLTASCIPCNSSKRSKSLLYWMATR